MLGKIWKIGFKELTRAGEELPQGATVDPSWRLPRGASGVLQSPEMRRDLLDMFKALGGTLPPMPDFRRPELIQLIVNRVNQGLDRGELLALHRRAPGSVSNTSSGGSGGGSSSSSSSGPTSSGGGGGSTNPEKTWVDVQLLDEDGEPIPGERYILKITDGSVREGSLDASGRVRVNGIDPGTCTVTFPDLDTKEWKRKS